ncbi:MAG TPA: hypothetical protein VKA88_02350 [Solirubrobacterales bacterium]|nr:hypothetical protein [Solirubrobacterales bacterium]
MSRMNWKPSRRRAAAALAAACLLSLVSAAVASAAVTVGQLPETAPGPSCPGSATGADYLQTGVTGGNLYSARQAGTITFWSTRSSGPGATYVFKVFRRTSDPDFFQVVGRSTQHLLTAGINTFPTSLQVLSGDLIGLHEQGPANSCTFPMPGDAVFSAAGDTQTGQMSQFSPVTNVRLNLSAVLVPSNSFTIIGIVRHRRAGTATVTVELSNPGIVQLGGKGLQRRHATTAVATRVNLKVVTIGKRARILSRRGSLKVAAAVTFYPSGGDPSTQTVTIKLRKKRQPLLV